MKITLTPKNSPTETEFYRRIKEGLDLGEGFGNNLDALYDVLTEPRPKFEIYVKDASFETRYGGRGRIILQVMQDAMENGGNFTLRVRKIPK